MNKLLKRVVLIASKVLLRIFLIVIFLLVTSVLLNVNRTMVAFAEVIENSNDYAENFDSEVEVSDFYAKGLDLNNERLNLIEKVRENYKLDIEQIGKIVSRNDNIVKNNKYVLVSTESADEYPEEWIENFNKKLIVLQKMFPKGAYWNHMENSSADGDNIYSVTDIPCNHLQNGEEYCNSYHGKSDEAYPYKATSIQCWGFASMLSDMVFGADAPVKKFYNYDEIRIGDQARIGCDYHTIFIIDKTDEYVVVAECNEDLETCKINWGRKIAKEDLEGWYITRWEE